MKNNTGTPVPDITLHQIISTSQLSYRSDSKSRYPLSVRSSQDEKAFCLVRGLFFKAVPGQPERPFMEKRHNKARCKGNRASAAENELPGFRFRGGIRTIGVKEGSMERANAPPVDGGIVSSLLDCLAGCLKTHGADPPDSMMFSFNFLANKTGNGIKEINAAAKRMAETWPQAFQIPEGDDCHLRVRVRFVIESGLDFRNLQPLSQAR